MRPGDIFFTTSPSALSKLINWGQGLKSADGTSTYSHTGVCTGGLNTFESLSTIRHDNLLKYIGEPFLLVRPRRMNDDRYIKGMCEVADMNGAIYPFHRLFLILGGLGRISIRNWLVCSELVAKFLMGAGIRTNVDYCGTTVDNLADEVHNVPFEFEILFEGILTRKELSYANLVDDGPRDTTGDSDNIPQGRPVQSDCEPSTGATDVLPTDDAVSDVNGKQRQRQLDASHTYDDANDGSKPFPAGGSDGNGSNDQINAGHPEADGGHAGHGGFLKKKPAVNIENLKPSD